MEAEEATYTDRAIEYFKKALDLLPGGWMAMEGLARCYGENLGEYETAIHWMEDAIYNLPRTDDLAGIDFYLETRISDWKLQLGDDQESVEIAQTSYESGKGFTYGNGTASDSSILRSIKHYIEALFRTGQYSRIVELLHDLDARDTEEQSTSLWTVFLRYQIDNYYAVDLFNKIGKITQELKNESLQEFMKASIQKATHLNSNTIADYQPIWLADQLAEWQYHYAPNPQESIEMWNRIVTLVDQSNEVVQQSQNWFRSKAAGYSALIYFNTAKDKFNADKDASVDIAKIEDLAQHTQGSKRYYRASYPALVLGLWLHEYMKADREVWSACIRPSIKQALYLLSDEDPWNDQEAYSQLGEALFAAGDILNASIAHGVTLKPLKDYRKGLERQESGDAQESIPNETEPGEQEGDHTKEDMSNQQNAETDAVKSNGQDIGELEEGNDPQQSTYDKGSTQEEDNKGKAQVAAPHLSKIDVNNNDNEEEANKDNEGSENDEINDEDNDHSDALDVSVNPKYTGFGYWWTCDGPCKTPQSDYAELWCCRVCGDSCFCEQCIELHRRDEIPARICAVDHPLVRIFPMIEEAKELTDALVERRFEVQQRWLDALRKEWED